ncbi:cell division protein ZipA [Alteromonadaceae bacterium M269]|nr:cell division protein ZipA [Alteromonadaceae bacterium M269]
MEELRIVFIVAGAFAIFGILAHGLWTIRKNAKVKKSLAAELLPPEEKVDTSIDSDDPLLDQNIDFSSSFREEPSLEEPQIIDETIEDEDSGHNYDDLGLGPVRVVSRDNQTEGDELTPKNSLKNEELDKAEETSDADATKSDKLFEKAPEYDMRLSRPDRNEEWAESKMPPPPSSLLKEESEEEIKEPQIETAVEEPVVEAPKIQEEPAAQPAEEQTASVEQEPKEEEVSNNKPSLAEQARNLVKRKKAASPTKRREPKLSEDQMSIDFDEPVGIEDDKVPDEPQPAVAQEVLVLNVKANDGAPIPGAALLPMLLTLGFKFGDQDIFHRHVNSNGKGPVLFSLANMFKPGVFDIDNLENFSTQGISLFMILPIEGDAHQVFNMMHNAARKISDEFGAQVLDGRRSRLNKQSLQQYIEKIREFERKRMIRRN